MVWKITPLFASWLASPSNILFRPNGGPLVPARALVLELGCGVSAILGCVLAHRVRGWLLTDQAYVGRLVETNIAANVSLIQGHGHGNEASGKKVGQRGKRHGGASTRSSSTSSTPSRSERRGFPAISTSATNHNTDTSLKVKFHPLDWETDTPASSLASPWHRRSFDAVVACDCVYNEALVDPFVSACADVCRLREQELSESDPTRSDSDSEAESGSDSGGAEKEEERGFREKGRKKPPCICVVAQQLRDPNVFEAWLARFQQDFHTWRVPDVLMHPGLRSNSGYVVHVGVLREALDI